MSHRKGWRALKTHGNTPQIRALGVGLLALSAGGRKHKYPFRSTNARCRQGHLRSAGGHLRLAPAAVSTSDGIERFGAAARNCILNSRGPTLDKLCCNISRITWDAGHRISRGAAWSVLLRGGSQKLFPVTCA